MLERFTARAREVVSTARAEAINANHGYVGTEHILVALLAIGGGEAYEVLTSAGLTADRVRADMIRLTGRGKSLGDEDAEALKSIGIDLDAVIASVEDTFGRGALTEPVAEPAGRLRSLFGRKPGEAGQSKAGRSMFSSRAKKVLELALREALAHKNNYIGTEHILLGLIRERDGLAMTIVKDAGVSPETLHRALIARLDKAA